MKYILSLVMILTALTVNAQATKRDTVCDTLYSVRKINPKFWLLNLGGNYPNQKLTVVLKLNTTFDMNELRYKPICVAGEVTQYKGKPQIVVTDEKQLLTRPEVVRN